jgi:hypothetical protein
LQAAAEQLLRLAGDDRADLVDQRGNVVRAGEQPEEAERDQQRRGDREEGVVRKRRGEIGDGRRFLLQRPLQDREVVALREVGKPRVA